MWLTRNLAPGFKTVAGFRRDTGEAIRLQRIRGDLSLLSL